MATLLHRWTEAVGKDIPDEDSSIPWMPALAAHGHRAMMVQLRDWWAAWARYHPRDPVEDDLRRAAASGEGPHQLTGPTQEWR